MQALAEARQGFASERKRLQQELADMAGQRDSALKLVEDARAVHDTDLAHMQQRLDDARQQAVVAEKNRSEAAARADALEAQATDLSRANREQCVVVGVATVPIVLFC